MLARHLGRLLWNILENLDILTNNNPVLDHHIIHDIVNPINFSLIRVVRVLTVWSYLDLGRLPGLVTRT
jgi:hypothetical protein